MEAVCITSYLIDAKLLVRSRYRGSNTDSNERYDFDSKVDSRSENLCKFVRIRVVPRRLTPANSPTKLPRSHDLLFLVPA